MRGGCTMKNLQQQSIELYSKQLRTPMFNQYADVIRQLDKNQSYEDFLVALMKLELDSRQESTRKRKIKTAGFPYIKTMDELDCSRFEHMDEAFIHELASCDFISKRQNIVMIGNPGTGKTHLSIALGVKACMQGMNVKFFTTANLSNELIEAQDNHKLVRLEKQIAKAELLIIDEVGYLPIDTEAANMLFQLINKRYEKNSTIITTNGSTRD